MADPTTAGEPRKRRIGYAEDSRFGLHRGPEGHPERPARLTAVSEAMAAYRDAVTAVSPRPAERDELLAVHTPAYLEQLETSVPQHLSHLDGDTYWGPDSLAVARLASGTATELALAVARNELDAGIAAIRPPGHHAESSRAMGFCLFNNVAVAAEALRREKLAEKVLIVDWDVHHGNGTQHHFEEDPATFFVSTHQFPFYPGTGAADEVGRGGAVGATFNVPLPAGSGDPEYRIVFEKLVAPAARAFAPDFVLVSCGFDAHRDDPLAQMQVSGDGFAFMASVLRELADSLCGGRLVFLLEGGYAASGLKDGCHAVAKSLLAEEAPARPEPTAVGAHPTLKGVIEAVSAIHGNRIPGLGSG